MYVCMYVCMHACMYVCMAHTSKTEGALFSSPQRDQVDHAPLYIKDPAWHQAVVYTRLNLLPKVAVAVMYCCLPHRTHATRHTRIIKHHRRTGLPGRFPRPRRLPVWVLQACSRRRGAYAVAQAGGRIERQNNPHTGRAGP